MDEAKELVMRVLVEIYDKLYHLRCEESGRIGNHNSKRQVVNAVYEVNKLLYDSGVAGSIEQIRNDPHELPYGYAWAKKKDMVEVVRCKDCVYMSEYTHKVCGEVMHSCERETDYYTVSENDFCSLGERKEDAKNN